MRKINLIICAALASAIMFSGCGSNKDNAAATTENNTDFETESIYEDPTLDVLREKADNDGFVIENGVLKAYVGKDSNITIPSTVTTIGANSLSGDMGYGTSIESIIVPSTVTTIEKNAFAFTDADIIKIEEGVTTIGDQAFSDSYISEIYFPESLTNIGKVIMQTEEGLSDCKIHVKKDSAIAKYFEKQMPYGTSELIYD